jgi:hypothetical protein
MYIVKIEAPSLSEVKVEGVVIKRPAGTPPSEWIRFWTNAERAART